MTKARDLASSTPVPSTVSTTELGYVDGVTSAIQTQINSKLSTSAAGLILINTTSFSGAASVNVNDVFTSTYNAYRVLINITGVANNDSNIVWRFRKAGTNNAVSYYYQWAGSSANASFIPSSNNATDAIVNIMDSASNNNFYATSLDIFGPQTNTRTVVTGSMMGITQGGQSFGAAGGFWHDVADQFDGFSFFCNGAGTPQITGTVRTYAYNQ